MKVTKSGTGKGAIIGRSASTGRFASISVPGRGEVRVVDGKAFTSAKSAAGANIRHAVTELGGGLKK